jgi:hypothetical protein
LATIAVDFENVDKLVDEGMYKAEIFEATPKNNRKDGSTYISWCFVITEPGPFHGRKLYYNSNLSDQKKLPDGSPDVDAQRRAAYFLKEFLDTVKAPYEPGQFSTESALHCKAIIDVKIKEYEGRDTNNIDKVMPYVE